MLPSVENYNCYEYLKHCTSIYPDVWMMQHFGVKYRKSEMFRDIDALSAYFQNDLRLKKGDVYTVFMTTTVQGILTFYALNQIGVSYGEGVKRSGEDGDTAPLLISAL